MNRSGRYSGNHQGIRGPLYGFRQTQSVRPSYRCHLQLLASEIGQPLRPKLMFRVGAFARWAGSPRKPCTVQRASGPRSRGKGPGARAWLEGGLRLVGLLHHHACAVRLTPVTLYSRVSAGLTRHDPKAITNKIPSYKKQSARGLCWSTAQLYSPQLYSPPTAQQANVTRDALFARCPRCLPLPLYSPP